MRRYSPDPFNVFARKIECVVYLLFLTTVNECVYSFTVVKINSYTFCQVLIVKPKYAILSFLASHAYSNEDSLHNRDSFPS